MKEWSIKMIENYIKYMVVRALRVPFRFADKGNQYLLKKYAYFFKIMQKEKQCNEQEILNLSAKRIGDSAGQIFFDNVHIITHAGGV